jgi:hypothetical protein
LGNIESLNSEIVVYKETFLQLDNKVNGLISQFNQEREISQATINALELKLKKNICKECSENTSNSTKILLDNQGKNPQREFSFLGFSSEEHPTTENGADIHSSYHVFSSTMIHEKPMDNNLDQALLLNPNISLQNVSRNEDESGSPLAVS